MTKHLQREDLERLETDVLERIESVRRGGTSTITSFGTRVSRYRRISFADSLRLTHNGTTLQLPNGGNDIITQAGDRCVAVSDTAGNWIVTSYQRANGQSLGQREKLSSHRTYYVRTDGSNNNNGLANTSGGAFLTIQKAIDTVAALDLSIHHVTIQVADGTYTAQVVVNGAWVGSGTVSIIGNQSTPANVVISTTSANCISASNQAVITVSGMTLQTTTSGICAIATSAKIVIGTGVVFGTSANHHIMATQNGIVQSSNNYTISGGGQAHLVANLGGVISVLNRTITLTGTPSFAGIGFIFCSTGGTIEYYGNTFSGSATGSRYLVNLNGVVNVNGATPNTYLPGNSNGSVASGGQVA